MSKTQWQTKRIVFGTLDIYNNTCFIGKIRAFNAAKTANFLLLYSSLIQNIAGTGLVQDAPEKRPLKRVQNPYETRDTQ